MKLKSFDKEVLATASGPQLPLATYMGASIESSVLKINSVNVIE